MKLCKNCQYYRSTSYTDICVCPILPREIDLVSGKIQDKYCSTERAKYDSCGPAGEYFKEKQDNTILYTLFIISFIFILLVASNANY